MVRGSDLNLLSLILKGFFVVPSFANRFLGSAWQYTNITSSQILASSPVTNIFLLSMLYEVVALNMIFNKLYAYIHTIFSLHHNFLFLDAFAILRSTYSYRSVCLYVCMYETTGELLISFQCSFMLHSVTTTCIYTVSCVKWDKLNATLCMKTCMCFYVCSWNKSLCVDRRETYFQKSCVEIRNEFCVQ